jgi:hypothetical protein
VKTHEHSAANAPQEEWRLHLLLLAAIEFAKLGSSEQEAAKKAHALLKECEKILKEEEGGTGSKPVAAKTKRQPILLNAGPIPVEPAFKDYFGGKNVEWEEGIVAITGENKLDRAEDKFGMFLKDLARAPLRQRRAINTDNAGYPSASGDLSA